MTLAVFIPGDPASQGSKRHVGGGRMVESSKKLKPWRSDVRSQLLDDDGQPKARFEGAVHCEAEFVMPRPQSTPKRSTPPAVKKADLDKLLRAVFDAVTSAGVWQDDKQVVSVQASKRLAKIGETPGLHLFITVAVEKREAA
jgi:crossover junction endodeoxyribonuclease RusA